MSPNFTALCYLHAFDHRLPIQDGLAFENILRTYRLDYSVKSLARVDDFLDELRRGKEVREDNYLDDPGLHNLLYLLNFYVGEVIARSLKIQAHWYTFNEVQESDPMSKLSEPRFENSVSLGLPYHSTSAKSWFRPLISLTSRLFSEDVEKSVLFSATSVLLTEYQNGPTSELSLPPSPARAWPVDVAGQLQQSPHLFSELGMNAPAWAKDDKLRFLFENEAKVMREGQVVWAAIVQANTNLFKSGDDTGAPLDVLYDPEGRLPPEDLILLAQKIYALKEKRPAGHALVPLHDHLKNEFTRAFGLDVPTSFVPYPLKVSSTYFERKNFPGHKLSLQIIPVLISDIYLGLAVPLPGKFWPADLLAQWERKSDASPTEAEEQQQDASARYSAAHDAKRMGAAPQALVNLAERFAEKSPAQQVNPIQAQKPRRNVDIPAEALDKIIYIQKEEKFRAYQLNIPFFLVIFGASAMAFAKLSPALSPRVSVGILISGAVCLLVGLYKAYKAVER